LGKYGKIHGFKQTHIIIGNVVDTSGAIRKNETIECVVRRNELRFA